jgi:hypothetical protein
MPLEANPLANVIMTATHTAGRFAGVTSSITDTKIAATPIPCPKTSLKSIALAKSPGIFRPPGISNCRMAEETALSAPVAANAMALTAQHAANTDN